MQINSPLCITSRLLPGVRIGEATISIGYTHVPTDARQAYRWFIDFPLGWIEEFKMASMHEFSGIGLGSGTLQEGLESLLSFLGAFAEAWQYSKSDPESFKPENCSLFPAELAEWAVTYIGQIVELELNLQEHPNQLIIE